MTNLSSSNNGIDFVLTWVDGSDPDWLSQFDHYTNDLQGDKRKSRYRDWGNLQYLFRSFEQCTPWVRKIHFVTCGHLPEWLNTSHEKLNIVKHEDFIDKNCLPVFSSHPIEINLHRIPGLAEKFVYLNDDTFILKKMCKERFFKGGVPRDKMSFNAVSVSPIAHILISDLQVINRNFNKFEVVIRNYAKIFNFRYSPIDLMKTFLLMPWPNITGFSDPHQPQPFLKSTFEALWEKEPEVLLNTTGSRTREPEDVNQYLFRYWQLCKGCFCPVSFKKTYSDLIQDYQAAVGISQKILSGKYEMICVNDGLQDNDFEESRDVINDAFKQVFPEKCSYEL